MINIAIDGPSGAGKSTIAKAVAAKLNIIYLDTGAMYRGVAVAALDAGLTVTDEKIIEPFLKSLKMNIEYADTQKIFVNGKDVTPYIRQNHISKAASDISALPCVRLKMVELQREIAQNNNVVLDGRDIGSYVLPNAKYKFYITAAPECRAKRRFDELILKGDNKHTLDGILQEINIRDYNDSHRAFAPLVRVPDAVFVDTTDMTIDEAVAAVINKIEE